MSIEQFYVCYFAGMFVVTFAIDVALLRWGLRWVKAQNITLGKVALVLLALAFVQTVIAAAVLLIASSIEISRVSPAMVIALLAGVLVAVVIIHVLAPCFLISRTFKIRWVRSFRAYLPVLVFSFLSIPVSRLVVRPYVMETYRMSGSSMAPTLLGPHYQGVCPECGGPCFCSALPGIPPGRRPQLMICRDHFRMIRSRCSDDRVGKPDRFIVAKLFKPKRWDIIAFRNPADPNIVHCKRVVGLPGEEITIRDGRVWADGNELTPPDAIAEIRYTSELSNSSARMRGTPERPATLAADEYFVLGDFSENSEDSRFWTHGALDHHPYAVPESYIEGVATHIIWPPERWSSLR